MASKRLLTKTDVEMLRRLADLAKGNSIRTKQFEFLDACITSAAKTVWVLRELSKGDWAKYTVGSADTIVRYVNETVGFILGEPRVISAMSWEALIGEAIAADVAGMEKRLSGNIGATILSVNDMGKYNNGQRGTSSGHLVRRDLLSLTECRIISMWTMRPNGVDDMIISLARCAEVIFAFQEDDD